MTNRTASQEVAAGGKPGASWRSALALVVKGVLLLSAAYVPAFAVFALIPEVNDFAVGSVIKHRRLEDAEGRRIVLVGGSNLSFGIDSEILERETGCQAVNMGMNGYLGVRFMFEEVKPFLRRGDIVVVAFEYDNFHKTVDGTGIDQLIIVKANPSTFWYLSWKQRLSVMLAVPYVAQEKVLRVLREAKDSGLALALGREPDPVDPTIVDMNVIESAAGYTSRGDLISHLGVTWPYKREDGVDMTNVPRDDAIIPAMEEFSIELSAKGVHVVMSYTSVIRDYYERHQGAIDALYEDMARSPALVVPSRPTAFVYEEPLFFDTVYHLNAEGRKLRSERLAEDINSQFDGPACAPVTSDTTVRGNR